MDRESVLRMAKESGVIPTDNPRGMELVWWSISVEELERFAALVAAAKQEECAKVASEACLVPPDGGSPSADDIETCDYIAAAIRALK